MPDKIKNFFLSFKRFKKPAALTAVLFCIILGLTIPTYSAQAFVQLIGMWVAGCVVGLILQLVLAISNLILGFAGLILSWVLSPYFINIPYTHLTDAAGNITIVGVGWPIVRDFANMFFILILVAIGISTALRIGDYQAKKALPKLIFIALFINFTPVLCGAIIDFCNILMNFFLEELTGLQLMANQFTTQGNMVLQMLTSCLTFGITGMMESIGKTIILMIFDWVAAFIFFMYALLFIMRYVMIWMLVILSPIAFFSMLLSPGIRRRLGLLSWDQWWEQFIEWSIIGILGAFYLYLSEQLLVIFTKVKMTPPNLVGISNWLPSPDWIGEMLSYMVIMAFMIVGFFAATSTSAMGAGFITNAFKKAGTGAAKAAGRGLTSVAKTGATALGYRFLRGPTEALARRMERTPTALPGGALIRMAGSQLERFPTFLRDRRTGAVSGAEKEASGKSAEEQAVQFKEAYTRAAATGIGWDKAVGNLRAAIKDGNFGDIQTYLKEKMGVGDEAITDMVRNTGVEAMKSGKHKEILQTGLFKDKEMNEMADKARLTDADRDVYGLKVSEADKATFGEENTLWKKTMSKLKENQMGNISKPIALSDEFQEVLHKFGTGAQARGLIDTHGREALDKIREEVVRRQRIDPNWYKTNNPKMGTFLRSPGASTLGIALEDDATKIGETFEEIRMGKREGRERDNFDARQRKLQGEFESRAPVRSVEDLERELKEKEQILAESRRPETVLTPEYLSRTRKTESEIEALKKEIERAKTAVTVPIKTEESLTTRIKKSQTKDERKRLQSEFDALPKEMQDLDKEIGRGENGIATREELIQEVKNRVTGLRDQERELEKTLEGFRAAGAPQETIARTENRLSAIRGERTKIEDALSLKEKGAEAAKRRVTAMKEEWKRAVSEKATIRTPEEIIQEHLNQAVQEEQKADKKLRDIQLVKGSKMAIENAAKELQTAREKREGWEGELAAQLRLRGLTRTQEATKSKITPVRSRLNPEGSPTMRRQIETMSDTIRLAEEDVSTNSKEMPIRGRRIREIKSDREKMLKTIAEEIAPRIQEEQLRLHPEMKVVPRDFLNRLLRVRAMEDTRYQALTNQLNTAQEAMQQIREGLRTKRADLQKLRNQKNATQTEYNRLSKEMADLEQTLNKTESEIGKIVNGEITPKLSRKERK